MEKQIIRDPVVAGMFYPKDRGALMRQIESLLNDVDASEESSENLIGAVVPHAGYSYSGPVAAYAYRALQKIRPQHIIIVGPSHREYFKGCSVYNGEIARTPLGDVSLDISLGGKIASFEGIQNSERGHLQEHAIEVQIPFLQSIYSHDFSVVMITMGEQSIQTVNALAEAIHQIWSEDMLLLASSDLSHYYQYDKAKAMDSRFAELIERYDTEGFWKALERHEIEACGFGPVMTLLELGKLITTPRIEVYESLNSGDITGERAQVIGYLSAGVYGTN